jgi:hypothetical protein
MSTYDDQANTYASAGPGYERRVKRLRLDEVPRAMNVKREKKPQPEYRANRKPRKDAQEAPTITARTLRHKIIQLSLQLPHFGDVVARLDLEGYGPPTKVLISNVRDHALTVLRVIMDEGLITEKALSRYRSDAKEEQRRRFKRRD